VRLEAASVLEGGGTRCVQRRTSARRSSLCFGLCILGGCWWFVELLGRSGADSAWTRGRSAHVVGSDWASSSRHGCWKRAEAASMMMGHSSVPSSSASRRGMISGSRLRRGTAVIRPSRTAHHAMCRGVASQCRRHSGLSGRASQDRAPEGGMLDALPSHALQCS